MLDRLPVELGQKILIDYGDGPWDTKDLVDNACLVSKGWRNRFGALRIPQLRSRASLPLARQQLQAERDRATTILVGTPARPGRLIPDPSAHPVVPVDDFHRFLALYPNARRAFLANLTEETLTKNNTLGGQVVPFVYLKLDNWRGLKGEPLFLVAPA